TEHLCLTAEGASRFAKAMGVPEVEEESLKTDYSRKRWVENLAPGSNPVESQMGKMGTVGAVAIDSQGNVASATSTGGMLNKMVGRVGDTPCVEHLCLTAEGASRFAKAMGVPEVEEESLKTDYSRKRWVENLAPGSNPVESQMGKMGTVGAVAIDSQGNVASATSTGGMLNKMVGRVGDTPCVGCGAYADNLFGAASPTGHGEAIMKVTLCRLILFHMEQGCGAYADNLFGAASPTGHGEAIMKVTLCRLILFHMEQGMSPEKAADTALEYMKTRVRGIGGVVVVNSSGDWAARFTSDQMAWAAVKNDQLHYGLYKGESFTLPVTST
ncbi:UNVERIFIED_CONTAM: hypothetical protein FKN15_069612, partial [Acipenser sinensis]